MSLPNEHTSDLSQHARVQDWGGAQLSLLSEGFLWLDFMVHAVGEIMLRW